MLPYHFKSNTDNVNKLANRFYCHSHFMIKEEGYFSEVDNHRYLLFY